MNNKKVQLLNYQLILIGLFIVSLIISIVLTYDQKQDELNNPRLFSENFKNYLNLFNRAFGILIIIGLLYIDYEDYKLNRNLNRNLKPYEHQIIASIFNLISALIALYVVFETWTQEENISSVENPNV